MAVQVNNEYYEIWRQSIIEEKYIHKLFMEGKMGEWKVALNSNMKNDRHELCNKYSFAVPDEGALKLINSYSPIVEIGAGGGYWASLLSTDIICYDNFSWASKQKQWFPVLKGDENSLVNHSDRTLFLCWPYMDSMAANCLKVYKGKTVIYIGEGNGGCTANDEFFEILEKGWTEIDCYKIPQWSGIHDYLTVYQSDS